jgi:signal transduction histidine kinase
LYSGLLALIIIVFGVLVFAVNRWVLVSSVDNMLARTADRIWSSSRVHTLRQFGDPSQIAVFLPSDLDFLTASGVIVQVWSLEGDQPRLVRASADPTSYSDPLDPVTMRAAVEGRLHAAAGTEGVYNTVRLKGGDWRTITLPHDALGMRVVIQAATSFDAVNAASSGLLWIMIVTTGLALIGSIIIGMILTDRALRPISDIIDAAEQITSATDLKKRLAWGGPQDELGHLVAVFNAAMERLEHLFSVQQRFVADVSHELRTPLTAIRGHFELIRRYGMDDGSLEAIQAEIGRMSRLVNDLLLLARADYGGLQLNKSQIALDELVEEVYREARALAEGHALRVAIGEFTPVHVHGDADRLKQLFLNLVTNAVKFTPAGGSITLHLRRVGSNAVVSVEDTGIGIAPDDLKLIFNRFYQADTSRTRISGDEGVGLGLSIALWIAEAHGGGIGVTSTVNQGTTFTVTIPHTEQAEHVLSNAVTRQRIPILRRGQHTDSHTIKP